MSSSSSSSSSSRNEYYLGGTIALLLQDHRTMSTTRPFINRPIELNAAFTLTDEHRGIGGAAGTIQLASVPVHPTGACISVILSG